MKAVPIDLLQQIADRKLEVTGKNIWNALRYRAHIQLIGHDGDVLTGVPGTDKVASIRLTKRGEEALASAGAKAMFNKDDLPMDVRLWVSSFRRWCRNCPKHVHLAYSDGQLHVLGEDSSGQVKDDDGHRLSSMKVPWVVKA
jgi:hypothetical protein